jgi:hypothetical protein
MISRKLITLPLILSSISFNSEANNNKWIEFNELNSRCENSKGSGYNFYDDYINGRIKGLEQWTKSGTYDIGENCPLPKNTTTQNTTKSTGKTANIQQKTKDYPFVSSKVLIKYSELFKITESQIGGWNNFNNFAAEQCGSMSCLSFLDSQAKSRDINLALLLGIIAQESGFNPKSKSKTSSGTGYFQFIKQTGKNLGYTPEQMKNPQLSIIAGVQSIDEALNWGKSKGFKGEKLRKEVIRYHMSGPSKTSQEYLEQIDELMREIPIIEKKVKESKNFWNNSSCKPIFDSPSIKALNISQERESLKLSKRQIVAERTKNKREIKVSKQCLEELIPDLGLPNKITQFGFSHKYGNNCLNEIENHSFSETFYETQIFETQTDPKFNFGEINACFGIHYNK